MNIYIVSLYITIGEYLKNNKIDLLSARSVSYTFLKEKLGKDKAMEVIKHAANDNDHENRWMLKYLSFGAIVLRYKKLLNKSCSKVISIGDGLDEAKATKAYSKEFDTKCLHFNFISAPTIEQLQDEWQYFAEKFEKSLAAHAMYDRVIGRDYYQYDIGSLYGNDNNQHFSGRKQRNALGKYFNLWMSLVSNSI